MAPRNFVVTVKEDGAARPYLLVEPHEDIGLSKDMNITMKLPEGADIEEARGVARFLNDNLAGFQVKKF